MTDLARRIRSRLLREWECYRLLSNWRKVSSSLHSGHPITQLAFRQGFVIEAPEAANLDYLFAEIWLEKVYAPRGLVIRDGDVVVDVGANVGVFSAFAASRARCVRVYAYEPSPDNAALLRANVSAIPSSSVVVCEQAVTGKSGRRWLDSHPSNWIVHTVVDREPGGGGGVAIDTVSLDDIFRAHRIERCHLLKLDCEGSEYDILRAAGPDSLGRVDRIVGEYHPVPGGAESRADEAIRAALESHGFAVEFAPGTDPCHSGGVFSATRPGR